MKKFMTVMAAAACAVSLTACGGNKSGSTGAGSNTLVVGAEELTGTFSPVYYSSAYDGYVVEMCYNKLYEYDENNTLQPKLAESFEYSEDQKSITFKLKEGVKFSNGEEFTADDVAFTFKAISDPSYTGRYGSACEHLLGHKEYSQQDLVGELSAAKAAKDDAKAKEIQAKIDASEEPAYPGIEVLNDYEIKFNFDEVRNDNLATVASIGILNKDAFEGYAYKNTKPLEKNMGKPVGTGPYVLKEWKAGSGAAFVKNEKYSANKLGKGYAIEKVIIKPVAMETEYKDLTTGGVDLLAQQIQPQKVGPATVNKDLAFNHYARAGAGYISYNCAAGATADKAVRQALTFAFNRQQFVDSYYKCKELEGESYQLGYVPATYQNPASKLGNVVRGTEQVPGLEAYKYDIEKAKQILDEAGWVVGADGKRSKDGKPLEVKLLAIKDHDILNQLIPMWKKDWGEQLGCDFKVAMVDFNTLLDKVYSDEAVNDWNVFFLATSYTSDNLSDIYTSFCSKYVGNGQDNLARLQDPELDAMMDAGMKELDPLKAKDLWAKVAVKVNEDCSMVPIYGNEYFDLYNKKVNNLKTNTLYSWVKALKTATIND